ncbi:MAG: RHS repeat-associated core domain-containing protein, partial [Chitinophagaceae bacterium]|nr:RHS repeat-associated core domain-containing protein [Chitinophagaceae bacterium]
DQLNRLVQTYAYRGFNSTANTWNIIATDHYREQINYDANGNIKTYKRNGDAGRYNAAGTGMDNMTYFYKPGTNQLDKVVDAAADASPQTYNQYNDIKQGQLNGNYQYDDNGNLTADAKEGVTDVVWNVYGKIASLKKDGASITYTYDASGNRISKQAGTAKTYYIRDAGGNVLSIYNKDAVVNNGHLLQTELSLYGSGRLGVYNTSVDVHDGLLGTPDNGTVTFTRGNKFFELTNHLDNVLATVSDKKLAVDEGQFTLNCQNYTDAVTGLVYTRCIPVQTNTAPDGIVDYYVADIITANDYYAFGSLLPGRQHGTKGRYLFNGKEQDPEVKGAGAQYDYGFRIYDPRLGRFLSVDPLFKTYPYYTPYQFASNNPIIAIDVDGLESSDDKNPTQLTQQEVTTTQNKIEALSSRAEILKALIDNDKKYIGIYKSEFLKSLGTDVATCWLPSRWFADVVWEGLLGNESNTDGWARSLANTTSDLQGHVAELQKVNAEYEAAVGDFKTKLSVATTFKTNDGLVFDKLGAAAIVGAGIHKNSKGAFGDWAFYEIKVDGQVLKFGIADAGRLRKGGDFAGLPERLAQQLSKISRNAPELILEYKITPMLGVMKAKALAFETKTIFDFAQAAGVPMANLAEAAKWAERYGISGLSAKAIKTLRPFLKLVK